jgi:hypothetical protein
MTSNIHNPSSDVSIPVVDEDEFISDDEDSIISPPDFSALTDNEKKSFLKLNIYTSDSFYENKLNEWIFILTEFQG